ncbi:IclR family transcriptional regulator [Pararhodobacter aggregans]|uniref:IclR family transcriptional regulator n=1 Tax=Pararhodobacter aggregans TaxID=404875 RepID=A0A2T7USS2_9RHOB|nr:IclR family transcriptional regulator [Pararhodobacter aggregans]PTX03495.1 IclR family transcriptional regulator [Pararhodobacter aggregans]PVE47783.1 IclR family transcriptional regulator [Pararhodobacter aggregans]
MSDSDHGRSGIQVIARAAAILRVLRDNTEGMSLGQIADRVELPRSTVQRIVGALQAERLVIATSSGGSIRLGPEITALSEATRYNVVEECRLHLSELSRRLGETADLSVLRGAGMIFLDQVPGTHRLRTISAVGDVFPLTTTANGRAALALLPEAEARSLVEAEWKRAHQPGDWMAFARMLTDIRSQGIAEDADEHTIGISALGGAFRDRNGEIHAISVPVPTPRFLAMRGTVEAELRVTLDRVRQHFGGS